MRAPREILIDAILEAQRDIMMGMQATATPAWVDLDLTIAQLKALLILETRGPMTVGQAASELGIGKPAASILVDRLVHAGLVGRTEDPNDRRRAIVLLTAEGHDLLARLIQGRLDRLHDALSQMTEEDLHALHKGLCSLANSLVASRMAPRP